MVLLFCGSNVFKQFKKTDASTAVCQFESIENEELPTDVLVDSTWCYAVFAAGKKLRLQGLLSEQPNCLYEVETAHNIKQIAACDKFVLVLCENGELFKILPEVGAILQEIKLDSILEPTKVPCKRSIFGELKSVQLKPIITHVACGETISVAVDSENRVYNIPSEVHRFPQGFKVKQLVCGFEHALLLNTNGDIYAWGTALRGQLGKDELDDEEAPLLVEALAGIKITFIAAGGWHSAAISAFGDLYVWGFNSNGQLCLGKCLPGEAKVFHLPQLSQLPECTCKTADSYEECVPVKVYAGARHLILVMQCQSIYAAGYNLHGQLGISDNKEKNIDSFTLVKFDETSLISNISCGHWNTFINLSKNSDKIQCDSY